MGRSYIKNTRININIPTDLLEELDAYAAEMHVTRTAALSLLLSSALKSVREG